MPRRFFPEGLCQVTVDDGIWRGGPYDARILHHEGAFPQECIERAVEILVDFRAECHRFHLVFNGVTGGRLVMLHRFNEIMEYADSLLNEEGHGDIPKHDRRISVGTTLSGSEDQKPGKSIVATHTVNEFCDSLENGGLAEDLQAKAFTVMIYHRWDEWYRSQIAKTLGLEKNQVRCCLMGEVRLLRNVIIHENSEIKEDFHAPILSDIWGGISPGFLSLTDEKVSSMMEQLNAIKVDVR